jgi:D-tyrosyl-tRNA(Tyr) deacylase
VIAVVQRVSEASVTVGGDIFGRIDRGLAVLVSVHADDTEADVTWTAGKVVTLRVFPTDDKHFDVDVMSVGGAVLLVSNFTVAALTRQGRRPSFDAAAKGEKGQKFFDLLVANVRELGVPVQTGVFGSDMLVRIVNDGPATFIVDSRDARAR